jgi:type IV pilus assembly protein PilA
MAATVADPRREEAGFTLVELMVVVLIIGILIAIALPDFLGARTRAQVRATQENLRTAYGNAKILYNDKDTYLAVDAAALTAEEVSLVFLDANVASTEPKEISVNPESTTTWVAAALSHADVCFAMRDDLTAGVTYASDVDPANCSAQNASATGTFLPAW